MIRFDQALQIVIESAKAVTCERISLIKALGRVLAQDVKTDMDMPPRDMSAMDGFACRRADLDLPLTVIDEIAAGSMPGRKIGKGQCARIMTGAPVPKGANCVVMIECTMEKDGVVHISEKSKNMHIRYKGEDLAKGDIVLKKGALITPAEIAVLASCGYAKIWVARQPVVGVIATGDELVEPDKKPKGAQIRNSNGWQLIAQIERAGCLSRYFGIARDTPELIDRKLKQALAKCDVVLLSGGVSAGDFDFVPDVLRKNDVKLLFEKIAIKPGKPTVFGIKDNKYFFGLPGNPVSTFVLFEMLVRPFLMKLMGNHATNKVLKAQLGEIIKRKNADRMEFRPVKLGNDGKAYGIEYHGSAHINAYTKAQGIIALPKGISELKAGVDVRVMVV